MATMEQMEMDAHRSQLSLGAQAQIEQIRSRFVQDVPARVDALSDRLVLAPVHAARDDIATEFSASRTR